MDFALCLTLDILASLVNAFFLVHDSENPKFGLLNSCARSDQTGKFVRAPEISGAQFRPNVARARAILEKLSRARAI
jgi:hypothetical protein